MRVSFDERVSTEVVRGVEEGRADIGICWDAADLHGLRALPYHRDQLAVAVHPSHPLAPRRTVTFDDTLAFDQVDILAGSIMQAAQQRYAAAVGKTIRHRIQVSTVDAACRIVAANLAIAIVPRDVAGAAQQALRLKIIPLTDAWARRQFVICVRDDAALSVPARLLVDSLCASAKSANVETSRPTRTRIDRRRRRPSDR